MALIAMLFAFMPSLQAMACAAEGCNPACSEQSAPAVASDTGKGSVDNCVEKHCVCAAGHCNHAAMQHAQTDAASVPVIRSTKIAFETEHPVFAAAPTPERPPRT